MKNMSKTLASILSKAACLLIKLLTLNRLRQKKWSRDLLIC